MEETPGRASLEKLGCRTPPQLHAGGVGRQQQQQEADLAGYLVVDEDTHGCVKNFCYLGDTLDGDGGSDLSVTGRIKRWMDEVPGAFTISYIQSSPVGDERSRACQLFQK